MSVRSLTDVDFLIAERIRYHRSLSGVTLVAFADLLGIKYQSAYKYEFARCRVSASRLFQIARILDVRVETFFEPLPLQVAA